jgi:hypothetical protein
VKFALPPWFLGFWAVFLTVTSLQPHRVQQFGHGRPIHAVLHVLAFGVLGSLAILTSSRRYRSLAIVCCVAHGFLIEVIQARLFPDAIEWGDIRDDTLGVVMFSLLTLAVLAIFRQRQNSN